MSRKSALPSMELQDDDDALSMPQTPSGNASDSWYEVKQHLHLGLSVKIGGVYSCALLRKRCRGAAAKLDKLEGFLADASVLLPVPAPPAAGSEHREPSAKHLHHRGRGASEAHLAAPKRLRMPPPASASHSPAPPAQESAFKSRFSDDEAGESPPEFDGNGGSPKAFKHANDSTEETTKTAEAIPNVGKQPNGDSGRQRRGRKSKTAEATPRKMNGDSGRPHRGRDAQSADKKRLRASLSPQPAPASQSPLVGGIDQLPSTSKRRISVGATGELFLEFDSEAGPAVWYGTEETAKTAEGIPSAGQQPDVASGRQRRGRKAKTAEAVPSAEKEPNGDSGRPRRGRKAPSAASKRLRTSLSPPPASASHSPLVGGTGQLPQESGRKRRMSVGVARFLSDLDAELAGDLFPEFDSVAGHVVLQDDMTSPKIVDQTANDSALDAPETMEAIASEVDQPIGDSEMTGTEEDAAVRILGTETPERLSQKELRGQAGVSDDAWLEANGALCAVPSKEGQSNADGEEQSSADGEAHLAKRARVASFGIDLATEFDDLDPLAMKDDYRLKPTPKAKGRANVLLQSAVDGMSIASNPETSAAVGMAECKAWLESIGATGLPSGVFFPTPHEVIEGEPEAGSESEIAGKGVAAFRLPGTECVNQKELRRGECDDAWPQGHEVLRVDRGMDLVLSAENEKATKTVEAIPSKEEQPNGDEEMTGKEDATFRILETGTDERLNQKERRGQFDGLVDTRSEEHQALRVYDGFPGTDRLSVASAESDDRLEKDLENIMTEWSEDDANTTAEKDEIAFSKNDKLNVDMATEKEEGAVLRTSGGKVACVDASKSFPATGLKSEHVNARPITLKERIAARMVSTPGVSLRRGSLPPGVLLLNGCAQQQPSFGGS